MHNESSGKALSACHQEKDQREEKKQQREQVLTTWLGESILQSTEKGNTSWPAKASPVKTRETAPLLQVAVPVNSGKKKPYVTGDSISQIATFSVTPVRK